MQDGGASSIAAHGSGSSSWEGFAVSNDHGFVQVPMGAPAHLVYGYILDHGSAAVQALEAARREEQELEALMARTRQRLALRRLMRGQLLSAFQLRRCCGRLLQHADVLQPLTDGLSLRVSDANRMPQDGQVVEIAWDFNL